MAPRCPTNYSFPQSSVCRPRVEDRGKMFNPPLPVDFNRMERRGSNGDDEDDDDVRVLVRKCVAVKQVPKEGGRHS